MKLQGRYGPDATAARRKDAPFLSKAAPFLSPAGRIPAGGGLIFAFSTGKRVFLYCLRPKSMQERPVNFNDVENESESTLIAPRFDAEEARRAHPVVPLAETQARAPFATDLRASVPVRRGSRRSWALTLLVVSLLAVGAVGGVFATKVLHRQSAVPAAQVPVESAPVQTVDATPRAETRADAPPSAAPREAAPAPRTPRRTREQSGEGRERNREEDAGIALPLEVVRGDGEERSDEGDERRGHGRGRERGRRHGGEDGEKEMRKTLKRVKGNLPRLVDVLTGP
jgi:hypothetical protein